MNYKIPFFLLQAIHIGGCTTELSCTLKLCTDDHMHYDYKSSGTVEFMPYSVPVSKSCNPCSMNLPSIDFNSMESPWNMKKGGYSYGTSVENMAKRPIDSPKPAGVESSILPAAKRMINAAMEGKGTSFPLKTSTG